jgi:telomerase reverse transcriptase
MPETFSLYPSDVLNRFPHKARFQPEEEDPRNLDELTPSPSQDEGVIRIMMYIFPRQFGLHNVFTSVVDRRQTAQPLQDYTLREEEIARKFPGKDEKGKRAAKHIPKRLRGSLPHLIQRLQVLHSRCAYAAMLQHYCPVIFHCLASRSQR